ncbi:MAG TPA: cytidylate kinase-like family protein [Gemmataceae bacterium]
MTSTTRPTRENGTAPGDLAAPRHGFRGEPAAGAGLWRPPGPAVAVSREPGARGGSIARRVGAKLGWQVVGQELLDYMAGSESARAQLSADLSEEAARWVEAQLRRLEAEGLPRPGAGMGELPRLILMLAAQGNVILVGRGAGFLLPPESTLHVRVVAPPADRVAYMAQLLRLSREEAEEEVRRRDAQRAEFLEAGFGRGAADLYPYDLILNSSRLGEENCAELILLALRARDRTGAPSLPPPEDAPGA